MSVAISWANKMQLAKCDIMVGFPISSRICVEIRLLHDQDEASQARPTPTITTYIWPRYHAKNYSVVLLKLL